MCSKAKGHDVLSRTVVTLAASQFFVLQVICFVVVCHASPDIYAAADSQPVTIAFGDDSAFGVGHDCNSAGSNNGGNFVAPLPEIVALGVGIKKFTNAW